MSDDLETPDLNSPELDQALQSTALSGTVRLAQSALRSPTPPVRPCRRAFCVRLQANCQAIPGGSGCCFGSVKAAGLSRYPTERR